MQNNRFEVPLTVRSGVAGATLLLYTAQDASDYLLNSWTGKRSPKHRAALQACGITIPTRPPGANGGGTRPTATA